MIIQLTVQVKIKKILLHKIPTIAIKKNKFILIAKDLLDKAICLFLVVKLNSLSRKNIIMQLRKRIIKSQWPQVKTLLKINLLLRTLLNNF